MLDNGVVISALESIKILSIKKGIIEYDKSHSYNNFCCSIKGF